MKYKPTNCYVTLVNFTIVIWVVTQRFLVEIGCVTIQIRAAEYSSALTKALCYEGLFINKEHNIRNNLVKIIILNCPHIVPSLYISVVYGRDTHSSGKIEKGSSYREFELQGVENK